MVGGQVVNIQKPRQVYLRGTSTDRLRRYLVSIDKRTPRLKSALRTLPLHVGVTGSGICGAGENEQQISESIEVDGNVFV